MPLTSLLGGWHLSLHLEEAGNQGWYLHPMDLLCHRSWVLPCLDWCRIPCHHRRFHQHHLGQLPGGTGGSERSQVLAGLKLWIRSKVIYLGQHNLLTHATYLPLCYNGAIAVSVSVPQVLWRSDQSAADCSTRWLLRLCALQPLSLAQWRKVWWQDAEMIARLVLWTTRITVPTHRNQEPFWVIFMTLPPYQRYLSIIDIIRRCSTEVIVKLFQKNRLSIDPTQRIEHRIIFRVFFST